MCPNFALNLFTTAAAVLVFFSKRVDSIPSEYSLPDVLERIYHNQLALEAAN